jgi:hypothetical protein
MAHREGGRLAPVILSTEAGIERYLIEKQPENAPASISRSFDPGSNSTHANGDESEPRKQSLPINSTEAGMVIDPK